MARRIILLALTALVLYGLAPAVLEVFGAWDDLDDFEPLWWIAVVGTQALATLSFCLVQRVALPGSSWFAVITSNLAGGALGRVIPGGAATAAAVQFRMLSQSGLDRARIATGVTAASILIVAALAALPILTVPFVLTGLKVPETLAQAALLGGAVFAVLFGAGALLMGSDRAIGFVGRIAAAVVRRLRSEEAAKTLPARLIAQRDLVRHALGRRWPEAMAGAAGRWILDFLTLLAALEAAGAQPNLALTLLAYCAAQLLAQVPITPGGLGVVEAGMTATLALAGIPAGQAAAAVLAYRLASYWLQLPAGLVAWLLHRRRYGEAPVESDGRVTSPQSGEAGTS
jgi:uncharacterized protein (TIRG00374 family)